MRDQSVRLSFLAMILGMPVAIVALAPDSAMDWTAPARFAALAWAESVVLAGLILARRWRRPMPVVLRVQQRPSKSR